VCVCVCVCVFVRACVRVCVCVLYWGRKHQENNSNCAVEGVQLIRPQMVKLCFWACVASSTHPAELWSWHPLWQEVSDHLVQGHAGGVVHTVTTLVPGTHRSQMLTKGKGDRIRFSEEGRTIVTLKSIPNVSLWSHSSPCHHFRHF